MRGTDFESAEEINIETTEFIVEETEAVVPLAVDSNGDLITHAENTGLENTAGDKEYKQAKEQDSLEQEDNPEESDDKTTEWVSSSYTSPPIPRGTFLCSFQYSFNLFIQIVSSSLCHNNYPTSN